MDIRKFFGGRRASGTQPQPQPQQQQQQQQGSVIYNNGILSGATINGNVFIGGGRSRGHPTFCSLHNSHRLVTAQGAAAATALVLFRPSLFTGGIIVSVRIICYVLFWHSLFTGGAVVCILIISTIVGATTTLAIGITSTGCSSRSRGAACGLCRVDHRVHWWYMGQSGLDRQR